MDLRRLAIAGLASLGTLATAAPAAAEGLDRHDDGRRPIQHVVVIFQENVSFDHYFGTYPTAANPPGEPAFHAAPGTPHVNGLDKALLTRNPNLGNPQRLDRSQARTCDQDHDYTHEQQAADGGRMDRFVQFTGRQETALQCTGKQTAAKDFAVMDYYDGNTVTALWNYAQRFAMSDNSFGTTYGPSTVGALNLVAANTYGAACPTTSAAVYCAPGASLGTVTGDPQPAGDICDTRDTTSLSGRTVGDLLNSRGVTWGWFEGGFGSCAQAHTTFDQHGLPHTTRDYIPHHEPFQYFASTANPKHLPPSSPGMVGRSDQAHHQYDLDWFWKAVDAGDMPAVSFLKAPAYQDGHAGYSNPLDEQTFLVQTLNRLQQSEAWAHTAVLISYDDSDGWYDHQFGKLVTQSQTPRDALTAPGLCGDDPSRVPQGATGPQQARCGFGPRLPLLAVSPFARVDAVDHHRSDQASIIRFIEDNWTLGRLGNGAADARAGSLRHLFDLDQARAGRLFLSPQTGEPG